MNVTVIKSPRSWRGETKEFEGWGTGDKRNLARRVLTSEM
jgi:hypothetical protein